MKWMCQWALAGACATALSACAAQKSGEAAGYQYNDAGTVQAAYVFAGWDDRNCAQYRLEPRQEDVMVPTVMYVWDGAAFTQDQDACKHGEKAHESDHDEDR
ncbi:hypothetical protein TK90_2810 (plasmid) [Thioalkalivibrio sp. K90mix]|uniref:hypothetical protein n=1 Tax=Thioalkalivibrio sp. (strain K90mix) TaxID=396595 RepID=UPI000195A728|nr:hypothetical protein [Thioalkalivibrio sp. K90mix]ADC73295.1 hypothetical protein TK90_2810 [Thioalkalivibrio sp. K90mix]